MTWLDVDDTMRETYGYLKEGVGYGYNKVKGLNALLAMASTAVTAPIIVAHRLRKGPVPAPAGPGSSWPMRSPRPVAPGRARSSGAALIPRSTTTR